MSGIFENRTGDSSWQEKGRRAGEVGSVEGESVWEALL